jgi:hypothetical protein
MGGKCDTHCRGKNSIQVWGWKVLSPPSHHREVGSMFFRNVGIPKSQYKTSQPKRPKYEKSGGSSLGRKIVKVLNEKVFHGTVLSLIRKQRKTTNIHHKYDNKDKATGAQTFDVLLTWGHTEL